MIQIIKYIVDIFGFVCLFFFFSFVCFFAVTRRLGK